MSKGKLHKHLPTILLPGENLVLATTAQVKGGAKKQLTDTLTKGAVASLAVSAVTSGSVGLLVFAVPPAVWVVVTSHRLLMIERIHSGMDLGKLVFDAPIQALTATLKRGLLNQVVVADRSDGQSLVRLNLGVRGKAARDIVSAVPS
jgi:hypothetical protein